MDHVGYLADMYRTDTLVLVQILDMATSTLGQSHSTETVFLKGHWNKAPISPSRSEQKHAFPYPSDPG